MKNLLLGLVIIISLSSTMGAQTWFKVAVDNDTIKIPPGTILQYGAVKGTPFGCGSGPALAADRWVTPTVLTATIVLPIALGVPDPAPCYVKELDVLETSVAQTITVNGKSVSIPIAAVIIVVPPVPLPSIKTVVGTKVCSNYTETYYSDGSEQITASCTTTGSM